MWPMTCSVKEEVVTLTGWVLRGVITTFLGSRCFGESKGEGNRPNIRWHKCWVCRRLLFSRSVCDSCLKQRTSLTDFLKIFQSSTFPFPSLLPFSFSSLLSFLLSFMSPTHPLSPPPSLSFLLLFFLIFPPPPLFFPLEAGRPMIWQSGTEQERNIICGSSPFKEWW